MSVTCRYILWTVQNQRTHANDFQCSEIRLTLAGSPVSWGGGVAITNPSGGAVASPEDESKLIDGSTATKCFASLAGDITFRIDNGADITFDGYQFCTGNDEPGRDPDDFLLDGSHDGSTWGNLSTVSNACSSDATLIAATRTAYTGVFAASGTPGGSGGGVLFRPYFVTG